MGAVTISSKYQVVFAGNSRAVRFETGAKISFHPYNGTLRVVIVPSIEEARGMLKGMNTDELREEVDEER